MKAITLQFPKPPCQAKWNKMPDNDLGKHCPVCKTDIFDFSDLTDDELVEILKHAPAKVCGKFRASQIGRPIFLRQDKLESKNPRFKKMLAATVLLAVSTPFLSAQDTLPAIKAPVHILETQQDTTLLQKLNTLDQDYKKAENQVIEGVVYIKNDSDLLVGVSILVLHSRDKDNIGTITDLDGKFSLSVPAKYIKDGIVKLEFNYVGLEKELVEVDLKSQKTKPLSIYMTESQMILGEIMIIRNDFYDPIYGR